MLDVEIKHEYDFNDDFDGKTLLQQRCNFFQRCQGSDETIHMYLEVVRNLAQCCSFYKFEEELLIRDRLVSGLNDRDLQVKVLRTLEDPTIEDVLNLCLTGDKVIEERAESYVLEDLADAKMSFEEDNVGGVESPNDISHINIVVQEESNRFQKPNKNELEGFESTSKNAKEVGLNSLFQRHGWAYPQCSACGSSYNDFKQLKGHLVEHAVSKNSSEAAKMNESTQTDCPVCAKKFESHHDLVSHYAAHTFSKLVLPKVRCSICGKLNSIRYVMKHMYTHLDKTEYPCTLCDKKFKSKCQLTAHIHIHQQHETHICDICGNKFKRKVYLDVHKQKMHPVLDSKIQSLECYLCRREYKSLTTLKTHIYWHSVPKNHLCTLCGFQFRRVDALRKHLMRADHNGVEFRKFECEFCQKKFYDSTGLAIHRYRHTSDRPFKCKYENCGKTYLTPQSLKEHHQTHTGDKPHHCKSCDYKCITITRLKRHELVHMGLPTRKPKRSPSAIFQALNQ